MSGEQRTGVWLVGARGNVATLSIVGALAMAAGRADATGMVTASDPVASLELPSVDRFVFGGHDVDATPLVECARAQAERDGVPDAETVEAVADGLRAVNERIEPGVAVNCGAAATDGGGLPAAADDGPRGAAEARGEHADESGREAGEESLRETVDRLRGDYEAFREANDLDRVVVVNAASTEPPVEAPERYDTRAAFERALDEDDPDLPASSLYAYAALVDGRPYVNFTPSTGSSLGGLRALADEANVPHAGRDAKTGETLVKSALGPMFGGRNLRVRSWESHNVLGNDDGRVLEHDANQAGKLESKGGVLDSILPDMEHERVRIDYTPSLGDWKTAWDLVHFEGFLDTEMTMQFTWRGSDSALAAPLVLDLVRLVAYADEHGDGGVQPQLASFFKSPMGTDEHDLSRQFDRLREYVREQQ